MRTAAVNIVGKVNCSYGVDVHQSHEHALCLLSIATEKSERAAAPPPSEAKLSPELGNETMRGAESVRAAGAIPPCGRVPEVATGRRSLSA